MYLKIKDKKGKTHSLMYWGGYCRVLTSCPAFRVQESPQLLVLLHKRKMIREKVGADAAALPKGSQTGVQDSPKKGGEEGS